MLAHNAAPATLTVCSVLGLRDISGDEPGTDGGGHWSITQAMGLLQGPGGTPNPSQAQMQGHGYPPTAGNEMRASGAGGAESGNIYSAPLWPG